MRVLDKIVIGFFIFISIALLAFVLSFTGWVVYAAATGQTCFDQIYNECIETGERKPFDCKVLSIETCKAD